MIHDGVALSMRNISKWFGATLALDDASINIRQGEVHALVGENGSGKSTLVKVLAGYHTPDSGSIAVGGHAISLPIPPGGVQALGIAFVHQDLGLVDEATVAENLLMDDYLPGKGGRWFRTRKRDVARAQRVLDRYEIQIDPWALIMGLTPLQKALVAIARAMVQVESAMHQQGGSGPLLVLDEPTVFLPRQDVERLFDLMRHIAKQGAGILFVSHDLDEVLGIADGVTVLRDGRVQATVTLGRGEDAQPFSKDRLVELIVGHPVTEEPKLLDAVESNDPVAVEILNVAGDTVADISFHVLKGEIVGITGLAGSGFDEVPYLLFGAVKATQGWIKKPGTAQSLMKLTPRRAMEIGFALLPGDRGALSGVATLTVGENVLLPTIGRYFLRGRLKRKQMTSRLQDVLAEFDVRPPHPDAEMAQLSGGNQQKALVAKWMELHPEVFLLHEPTQGVDVGARARVFASLKRFAEAGGSAVIASSDLDQLEIMCNRVLVFSHGRIVAELAGADTSKAKIATAMLTRSG